MPFDEGAVMGCADLGTGDCAGTVWPRVGIGRYARSVKDGVDMMLYYGLVLSRVLLLCAAKSRV